MAIEINRFDNFQTRFFQSFVNMTQLSVNTLFPAVTTVNIHATNNEPLTSYTVYDQWALIISKIEEMICLPYNARRDCKTFLKMIKADINQVSLDGNSLIPEKIRDECFEKFKDIENFKIPEICGKMSHTVIFNEISTVSSLNNNYQLLEDEGTHKEKMKYICC